MLKKSISYNIGKYILQNQNMQNCDKLADLPSTYYNDMPFTKYKAAKIIKATGARKKQFTSDEQFKTFLKVKYAEDMVPMLIGICRESDELRKLFTSQLLQLTVE